MNLLGPGTRKAQVSGLATGAAAALTAVLPIADETWGAVITVILAVLAAYGITYQIPNKGEPHE